MTGSEQTHAHPNYVAVWGWLVVLAILSVLISAFPFPHAVTLLLIFEIAVLKALLVAMYFMHLKFERPLIYALVIVPLMFFLILMLVLFPDIAYYDTTPVH